MDYLEWDALKLRHPLSVHAILNDASPASDLELVSRSDLISSTTIRLYVIMFVFLDRQDE